MLITLSLLYGNIFPYILLDQALLLPKVITPMQSKSDLESIVKHMLEEYIELHLLLSKKLAPGHHQGSGGGMIGNKTEMDLYQSALNKNSLHLENPRMTAFLLSSFQNMIS